MGHTYKQHRPLRGQPGAPPNQETAPVPNLDALMTGASRPTAAQKGRSIDLDAAMKAKMEHAFGDLSGVKLYESPTVGAVGAEAIARGSEIAFAPGMADFSSRAGQERLGHELSHVMSQRSGRVRGQGFLASSALEARADREGALAAAGEQVYTGPVTHALSGASPSPMSAGVMQASRNEDAWEASAREGQEAYERAVDLPEDDPNVYQERTWQISEHQLERDRYNPTGRKDLAVALAAIDAARTPSEAYEKFSTFAESGSELLDLEDNTWDPKDVDPKRFKAKLKNMMRMVYEYPELKGKIGNMTQRKGLFITMTAGNTHGGRFQSQLQYNPLLDKRGLLGGTARFFKKILGKFGHSTAPGEYTGTHELGHVLNSLIIDSDNAEDSRNDWHYNRTANDMLQNVLNKNYGKSVSMDESELKRHAETSNAKRQTAGQIDLKGSNLYKKGLTSRYGQTNAAEFFAEAFADVMAHGKNAMPASIKLVKLYEARRDRMKDRGKLRMGMAERL